MGGFASFLSIAQIFLAITLIVVILLQSKGSTFSGAFSTDASVFSTRRGAEKLLFQVTLVLAVIFVLTSIVASVVVARGGA